MSTANDSRNSTMTSEAYDLLDCFVSGLDDVIYEIAESIAAEKGRVSENGIVDITVEEVQAAAQMVFNAIREQAGKEIPQEIVRQLEARHESVLGKRRIQETDK